MSYRCVFECTVLYIWITLHLARQTLAQCIIWDCIYCLLTVVSVDLIARMKVDPVEDCLIALSLSSAFALLCIIELLEGII